MKLYVRFFNVFFTFFQNPKKHDFLRFFELLHTFSRTMAGASPQTLLGELTALPRPHSWFRGGAPGEEKEGEDGRRGGKGRGGSPGIP